FSGECYGKRIDEEKLQVMIKSHRFIIAMENSGCLEYVSEKAFRYKSLIVPIVLSRRLVGNILPSDAFIAIDDFANITQFQDHIKMLERNDFEYKK
ncbi:hypothetical protein PFISCL1PPCAC_25299, partial [Pristionchus fissidentatus]